MMRMRQLSFKKKYLTVIFYIELYLFVVNFTIKMLNRKVDDIRVDGFCRERRWWLQFFY